MVAKFRKVHSNSPLCEIKLKIWSLRFWPMRVLERFFLANQPIGWVPKDPGLNSGNVRIRVGVKITFRLGIVHSSHPWRSCRAIECGRGEGATLLQVLQQNIPQLQCISLPQKRQKAHQSCQLNNRRWAGGGWATRSHSTENRIYSWSSVETDERRKVRNMDFKTYLINEWCGAGNHQLG